MALVHVVLGEKVGTKVTEFANSTLSIIYKNIAKVLIKTQILVRYCRMRTPHSCQGVPDPRLVCRTMKTWSGRPASSWKHALARTFPVPAKNRTCDECRILGFSGCYRTQLYNFSDLCVRLFILCFKS